MATPGRLASVLKEDTAEMRKFVGNLKVLVLDEFDRLIEDESFLLDLTEVTQSYIRSSHIFLPNDKLSSFLLQRPVPLPLSSLNWMISKLFEPLKQRQKTKKKKRAKKNQWSSL